jgi:hypothetical protein
MLDADEALRHSEQGQSFYAFWKLLLSDQRRQQFQVALQQVLSLPDLNDRLKDSPLLRDMIRHLQIEGEKVLDSSQRMATNLRRVLDTTRAADRTKVQELIKEIHTMAVRLRANPPQGDILMVEEYPEIFASMSRPLFEPKTALNELKGVEVANDEMSVADLERLASLPDIQLEPLIRNVEACLEQQPTVTLENVLDRFPPEHGMLQVLGYIMVATGSARRKNTRSSPSPAPPPPAGESRESFTANEHNNSRIQRSFLRNGAPFEGSHLPGGPRELGGPPGQPRPNPQLFRTDWPGFDPG